MYNHFSKRSHEKEILDDFELKGNDLSENLRELNMVNRYLGGFNTVRSGITKLLKYHNFPLPLKIADIGSGGGDNLRYLARWGRKRNISWQLCGIDANESAVNYSRQMSSAFPEIEFKTINILSQRFKDMEYDIVMFNLFLHHFEDEQIVEFLKICKAKNAAILINDLQRSVVAYHLFRLFSRLFGFSYIGRHDGKLSICKSFKRSDWQLLLHKAGIEKFQIKWRWAFRYRVLIFIDK